MPAVFRSLRAERREAGLSGRKSGRGMLSPRAALIVSCCALLSNLFIQVPGAWAGTASVQLTVRATVAPKCVEWSSEVPRYRGNGTRSCLPSRVEIQQRSGGLTIRCAPGGCPHLLYREAGEGLEYVDVMF
jgi:hypothetical protein